ncbi:MAG TPA: cardiolipin synthase [Methanomassiliicoccales archaeon]|nr:cardiolipin synthase [Methanomassiliicoccales archaeon]
MADLLGILVSGIYYLFSLSLTFTFINVIIVILTIVFVQKKRPEAVLVWIMAFLLLPVIVAFVFYLLLGRDYYRKRIFRQKFEVDRETEKALDALHRSHPGSSTSLAVMDDRSESLARMVLNSGGSVLTSDNEVTYYNEGDALFRDMLEAIRSAKRFVHMEFYIIRNDSLAREFEQALTSKRREGVEVKVLMDAVGCHKLPRRFFGELRAAGGRTKDFFPSVLRRINLRINNRNHRKLLVVDGDVAFVGGYNIGKEYIGEGKLGYWRDCMLRVKGSGAISVEQRFVQDWNFASRDELHIEDYAPTTPGNGSVGLQIVSGGPDTDAKPIEEQYLKTIMSAREYLYIQTPYFVPSEAIMAALVAAAGSGVDVRVMIPSKPDHPFVYWATLYYAGQALSNGVRVHQFRKDGFVHAKTMVSDDRVASIGSANFDIRSFELNFETNGVVYGREVASRVKSAYLEDVEKRCKELTPAEYQKRSLIVRFMEAISRLYTPVA